MDFLPDSELNAAILSIGDELLIGQVINSNAATIGRILTEEGFRVTEIISISDDEKQIRETLDRLIAGNSVIISTGGLGPTHDDITKQVLLSYFGGNWQVSEEQLAIITAIFDKRGRSVTDLNRQQADVPSSGYALINEAGTAPGIHFKSGQTDLFFLPGVPSEMQFLMENRVRPLLQEKNPGHFIVQKTIRTTGIPESTLAERIGPPESFLPTDATLAFLPNYGGVRLRVLIRGTDKQQMNAQLETVINLLKDRAGKHFYGEDEGDVEHAVVNLLTQNKWTLSLAESCTGGLIADKITNIPGVSQVYLAGLNTYSNEAKIRFAGVKKETLESFGAVSRETAIELADGVRKATGSTFSLSVTGIAGPTGGTPEKPVGLVFCAVSSSGQSEAFRTVIPGDRRASKERASAWALNQLREFILSHLKV